MAPLKNRGAATIKGNTTAAWPKKLVNQIRFFCFLIDTPLMWIDKAATWAMAEALGGQALVDLIIEHTHTCYLGDRQHRHAWGYGCGQCPACELRARGFAAYARDSLSS